MRYERKFVLPRHLLDEILQLMLIHPAGFREVYYQRRINNIYFDTANFDAWKENLDGIQNRSKFRIRWYGEDITFVKNPILEEKIKNNLLGTKRRWKLPDFVRSDIQQIGANNKVLFSKLLLPSLFNSYVRRYFLSADQKFRLTVDEDICYQWPQTSEKGSYPNREVIVVEIKYEEQDVDLQDTILQYFPYRPSKNSKYSIGMEMLWQ